MLQQDDLLTQKIELLLEMNSKKLLAEIAKLHQEVADVREEVAAFKKQQRSEPAPQPPWQQQQTPPRQEYDDYQRSRAPEPPQGWQPRNDERPEPQEQRPANKPIDRNGVAPADVNIEKMFYFGNKKR